MTPDDLKTIRLRAGMGVVEFGRALGFQGNDNTLSVHVRAMEAGRRPIMDRVAGSAWQIKLVVDVRLPRPRDVIDAQASPEFGAYFKTLWNALDVH